MTDLVKSISEATPYALIGMLLAISWAYFQSILTRKERRLKEKLEREHLDEMLKQIRLKDERIEHLHEEITRLLEAKQEKREISDDKH